MHLQPPPYSVIHHIATRRKFANSMSCLFVICDILVEPGLQFVIHCSAQPGSTKVKCVKTFLTGADQYERTQEKGLFTKWFQHKQNQVVCNI